MPNTAFVNREFMVLEQEPSETPAGRTLSFGSAAGWGSEPWDELPLVGGHRVTEIPPADLRQQQQPSPQQQQPLPLGQEQEQGMPVQQPVARPAGQPPAAAPAYSFAALMPVVGPSGHVQYAPYDPLASMDEGISHLGARGAWPTPPHMAPGHMAPGHMPLFAAAPFGVQPQYAQYGLMPPPPTAPLGAAFGGALGGSAAGLEDAAAAEAGQGQPASETAADDGAPPAAAQQAPGPLLGYAEQPVNHPHQQQLPLQPHQQRSFADVNAPLQQQHPQPQALPLQHLAAQCERPAGYGLPGMDVQPPLWVGTPAQYYYTQFYTPAPPAGMPQPSAAPAVPPAASAAAPAPAPVQPPAAGAAAANATALPPQRIPRHQPISNSKRKQK